MRIRYYGKLLEELKLTSKEDANDVAPIILNENDVPQLANIFNFLNNKDKDILFLIFISNKTQTDIVKILERSQPSLSYDIRKIKQRIRFICYLHSLFSHFTEWIQNEANNYQSEQVMVMTLMFFTTSFSQSSRVSNIKPTKIRYIFDKTLAQLKKNNDTKAYELFSFIRNNLNTVKREYLRSS